MSTSMDTHPTEPPMNARGNALPVRRHPPLLLWGVLIFCAGIAMYLTGVLISIPRILFGLDDQFYQANQWIVWNSGMPITAGILLILTDLILFYDGKRFGAPIRYDPVQNRKVTVSLTAYNDEDSIVAAVEDFLRHPLVQRVIVVSNNSRDRTFERAEQAGAITFNEELPGYGRCVYRCLSEAVLYDDTECVVLCEGDCTFRAYDIEKLFSYIHHADIVNGTRTNEVLREHETQLSTFMYFGNVFVGKLLEAKHLGRGTITDVGTTYKLIRRNSLQTLLPKLNPAINLEFNAHLLDTALENGYLLVEVPITFHPRVGLSKGGNINDLRGLSVGLKMIRGIAVGWRSAAS